VGTAARDLGNILRDRDPRRAIAVYDLGLKRQAEIRNNLKARRDEAVLLADSSYPLRALSPGVRRAGLTASRNFQICESGSIEQDANAVWLIHMPGQHSKEADPALCELMIGKNRKGPRAVINLQWAADYTRFDNWRADGD
jgi:DnaB-like helicase C terminal domain